MRIIFFGSDPWFSGSVLSALLSAGFEVPIVVTKGDAIREALNIIQANTQEDISRLTVNDSRFTNDNRPEAIVLASFGPPFLPAEVLRWPKYGCLNVHASLLPRWRGASPVFAVLAAGDKETGVSIMRMTEEIDRGPVLGQKKTKIQALRLQTTRQPDNQKGGSLKDTPLRILPNAVNADTRETLTKRLGKLGGELIVETLKKLEKGQITETPQPQKSPTPYTRRLTKDSGRIDWSRSPIEIERFIRAVTPWPGAWAEYKDEGRRTKDEGKVIKILKAHVEGSHPSIGRMRTFRLVIDLIQLPGKNPVSWKQFAAGHPGVELW